MLLAVVLAPTVTIVDGGFTVGVPTASAAQLTATWADNASGTAFFKVERKTGTTGTYSQIGTTATGVTSYVDNTLTSGTTYCYRVRASNANGDSGYSNEACRVAGGTFDVTVARSGTGAGMVVSSPTGINCGSDCFESFTAGRVVTLTPTPAAGSVFAGWSGGGCTGTSPCVTTGNAPVSISAMFSTATQPPPPPPPPPPASYTLTTTKSGTGTGTVASNPAGISCGSDCTESVTAGTTVTLTATPSSGSTFSGWSAVGCTGTGPCRVTVNGTTSVNATFTAATTTTYTLTITKAGTGAGTVVSVPAGITCGTDCSQPYASGSVVTLTATAATGSTFTGWTGTGCGSSVTMTSSRGCTANFAADTVSTPPPTSPCPCTIWRSTTTPRLLADPDRNAVELGVKFRADSNGYIRAIRFYKSSANTGTHYGRLWTSTGTRLASVTFRNETGSGWQQANLSTPVAITANTTYIVSYYTPGGRYSVDEGYFSAGSIYRAPLRALSNAAGGNGVYRYGGGFPNQTYNASNYWVDVVFTPR